MALTEIVSICQVLDNCHILVYVKKKRYDPTFENIKPIIEANGCRVIDVEYGDAEATVQKIFEAKQQYNQLIQIREHYRRTEEITTKLTNEDISDLCEFLNVDADHMKDWLLTIVMFDDVGNSTLFRNPDSYFNNRLKLCRDDDAPYYLCIHGMLQLSASIKENALAIYIFKGLPNGRLYTVYINCNMDMEYKKFKVKYEDLRADERCLVCDNFTGRLMIEGRNIESEVSEFDNNLRRQNQKQMCNYAC
jgi:hypothetical protein